METTPILSGLVAALFLVIHVFAHRLRFAAMPRSVWLSAAGGVAVAYVFIHLLPELAAHQRRFDDHTGGMLEAIETHSYLIALLGLAVFYGLERLIRRHRARGDVDSEEASGTFWIHLGAFAVYNLLIGYLLVHREEPGIEGLLLFGTAMALHLLVNDQGLRDHHGRAYHRRGRWILAGAPVAGWLLGLATEWPPLAVSALFAFLAGGVILNVLKEELPEDRESRFWAFAAGAAAYSALLLAVASA
ncbi:MAG: hypothetical protein ACK40O_10425 [Allosphingosinicella sp.]